MLENFSLHIPGTQSDARRLRVHRGRLLRTSAFRLAIIYAVLFSLLSAATLGFIYWSTRDEIESQVDARLRLETDYLINLYKSGALAELLDAIQRRNQIDTYGRFYYLESGTNEDGDEDANADKPLRLKSVRTHSTKNMGDVVDLPPGSSRAFNPVRVAVTRMSNGLKLTIGHEISDEKALLDHTFGLVVGATLISLIFAIIGGGWIGSSVLRRIDSVNRTAREIISGDLGQRIPVTDRRDEFDEIAIRINAMLNRIEDLMESMQQVTNNVAHDLRSPLTRLRNRLEVTLLEDRNTEEYQQALGEAMQDADSLINTFNAMLSIARLEAGIDHAQWAITSIGDLVEELAELYMPVAEEQGQAFETHIRCNPRFFCNRHLIAQAVTNLIDNAMKYSPEDGRIEVWVEGDDDAFSITVSDNGPGIDKADRERVLQRFVRLENERNSPGNGLGLSLVKAVASIHGAKLSLADNEPGLAITLSLSKRRSANANA
ncbi:MAG TPA: two-component sensor histidine kinase [Gammaproteobacteria bacterium]|nr:two-component sensor histidine kinase [Gammaproteobacteria bacterium]